MSALHFGNEGQSLKRFVHSRGGKCVSHRGPVRENRGAARLAEGQSLEHFVHRGVR
jgi:hypothetical protein